MALKFGPFTFSRGRMPAVEAIQAPPATTWHFVIQLSSRLSVQWLVIRFDPRQL
ncbi:MAG: hypothetical protein ACREBE_01165 [bacterium]